MTQTYFRVQSAERDVNELLDPGYQFSHAWSGGQSREGVSVCGDLEELALYLASAQGCGIPVTADGWVIVELEADPIPGARPIDPEFETLVRPTRIVGVTPVGDEFIAAIASARAFLDLFTDPNGD